MLDQTGGVGVVDDPSRYKPLPIYGQRKERREREEWHRDRSGRGDRRKGGQGRVVNSEIRNADIVYGTEKKVLEAMGKLLLEEKETIPGSVNLLGCNPIDWTEELYRLFRGNDEPVFFTDIPCRTSCGMCRER